MKKFFIKMIANSIESGFMKNVVLEAFKLLAQRTENTIDDRVVELIDTVINNKPVDPIIGEALAKLAERK